MAFSEKSAWACLAALVIIFVPYCVLVFEHPMAYVGLFPLATAAVVIVLTVFHVINALACKRIRATSQTPPPDEMDRAISLRAAQLAGGVLACAVVLWCMAAMVGFPALAVADIAARDGEGAFAVPLLDALTWVHWLFAGFVLANIVYYGRIIVSYRILTHG